MNKYLLIAMCVLLPACASLNSVSLTQIPANRGNKVTAQSERWIIFGFNFDNDYADRVSNQLATKCPGGKISGILTKDEMYNYFLLIVLRRQVTASGYCEKGAVTAHAGETSHGRKYNSVVEDEGSAQRFGY